MTATATPYVRAPRTGVHRIPLLRLIQVELRKMFNTRSGFWLLASIVIATILATMAVIVFAPDSALTYSTFIQAIRLPIAVILPIIAATRCFDSPMVRWAMVRISRPVLPACCAEASSITPTV